MPDSFLRKKAVIAVIIIAIVALMGMFLFMTSEGKNPESRIASSAQNQESVLNPNMGKLGATCGGHDRLPCEPGLICNTAPGEFANTTGVCVKDNRSNAKVANEGEECDGINTICQPSFICQTQGGKSTCVNMVEESKKSFIFSLIPDGAELEGGIYKAAAGTTLHVKVEAVNVVGGGLYYMPITSNTSTSITEKDKVATLSPSKDKQNIYEANFTVQKKMLGQLFARMVGKDGQTVSIPVTVGAK